MERKLVTIETIQEVKPIDGADKIEVVRVRDWWVVSRKDEFKVGDRCMYFEIDSFLPVKPEYEFLLRGSRPKRMIIEGNEIEGIKLKTIRLRGQLSQGLVLPVIEQLANEEVGADISEKLGVIKFEAPIPAELSNIARGNFPEFLNKTDEERIQNCSKILDLFKDELVYISEKIDGTSATYYKREGVLGACSRNMDLKESESVYWKIAKEHNLLEKLPDNMCIQGEIVGEGIQKNPLKLNGQQFFVFNIYNITTGEYYSFNQMIDFCQKNGLKTVPIIETNIKLDYTVESLLGIASGKSMLCLDALSEGIVVRSMIEQNVVERGCPTRLSFKVISNLYLLKIEE